MTTLQQLYDAVKVRYMRECERRNIVQTELDNGEFKLMYDIKLHEIFRHLNITDVRTEVSVSASDVFAETALPSTFGGLRGIEAVFGGNKITIEQKNIAQLPTVGELSVGTPNSYAIYTKSDGLSYLYLYPLPSVAGTVTIRHKLLHDIANGAGASTSFSTATVLPVQYKHLMIHGIMSELIPELEAKYYAELQDAVDDRSTPVQDTLMGSLGFDEEDDNTFNL